MTMMERFLDMFNDVMANRMIAVVVMISAAIGGVISIAGGYFGTYKIITLLSNN
jgi:hypothetical protein